MGPVSGCPPAITRTQNSVKERDKLCRDYVDEPSLPEGECWPKLAATGGTPACRVRPHHARSALSLPAAPRHTALRPARGDAST